MSRTFAQTPLALWRDPRFKTLSRDAQIALFYFWTGPHSKSAGIGVYLDGYAAIDLGMPLEEWQRVRTEVEGAGFIARDPATETVLVRDYFKANKPSGPRHLAAIRNQIAEVQCLDLQQEAERALASFAPDTAKSDASPALRAIAGKKGWSS